MISPEDRQLVEPRILSEFHSDRFLSGSQEEASTARRKSTNSLWIVVVEI